jgi:hypothetical protein
MAPRIEKRELDPPVFLVRDACLAWVFASYCLITWVPDAYRARDLTCMACLLAAAGAQAVGMRLPRRARLVGAVAMTVGLAAAITAFTW